MKRSRWYALGVSLLSGCALLTPKIGSASAALHESVEATSPNFGELGVGTVRGSTPFDTKHGTGREDFVPFAVRDQVKRATRVTLDLAPIFEGNREGSASVLEFEGFPGETHRFQRFSLRGVNGITWTGRLVGSSEHGEAVVSRSGSSAYGVVEVGSKRYIFQSDSDHEGVLWEVDPSKEHACAVEGEGESHLSKASANTKVGGATDIDLLVYFTEEVGLDASPLINTMVASANVGMAASGVNATVNVVGYRRIDTYNPETGAEFGLAAGAIYVGNDEWSGTATLRDDLGADLVVLLVEPPDPETQETCGIVGTNLAPLQLRKV